MVCAEAATGTLARLSAAGRGIAAGSGRDTRWTIPRDSPILQLSEQLCTDAEPSAQRCSRSRRRSQTRGGLSQPDFLGQVVGDDVAHEVRRLSRRCWAIRTLLQP